MTAKYLCSSEFHLFIEALTDTSALATPPAESPARSRTSEPLILPQSPACLALDETAQSAKPQFQPISHAHVPRAPRFESIGGRGTPPRLLLLTDPERPAFVNGHRAPRVALLRAGDRLHFDDTYTFMISIYHRPRLGPLPPELEGEATCPICTIPLTAGERAFICPCGAAFHAAEDETVEGALCCARMVTECNRCQQPLRLEPGYDATSALLDE